MGWRSVIARGLKIGTWNLRLDTDGDGKNSWTHRKERVGAVLLEADADVWGFQEPFLHQVDDVAAMLSGWKWVGRGRGRLAQEDELNPIFVRPGVEILEFSTRWISETPDQPGSLYPGAGCPRMISCARITHGGIELSLINTHFDHISAKARALGVAMVVELLGSEAPTVVVGDFNCHPCGPDFDAWRAVGMREIFHEFGPDLPTHTYHGFGLPESEWQCIDSIWVSKDLHLARAWSVHDRHRLASDHLPFIAEVMPR